MMKNFVVRVPATSANMGPGFDCLALTLDIWNEYHVTVGDVGISITGESADLLPKSEQNLVYRSIQMVFEYLGEKMPAISITYENIIPVGRGLGSSASAVVGGLLAGNELCGNSIPKEVLLDMAADMEGHADNSAAALFGGCQIVVNDNGNYVTSGVSLPDDLKAVLFIPKFMMPTDQSRAQLPVAIGRNEAIFNISRAALLINLLNTGNLSEISLATQDQLHQAARTKNLPAINSIFKSALNAGALGVFLSGAGSTVLALAKDRVVTIGYEMADAAGKFGFEGDVKVTIPTNMGAHVV